MLYNNFDNSPGKHEHTELRMSAHKESYIGSVPGIATTSEIGYMNHTRGANTNQILNRLLTKRSCSTTPYYKLNLASTDKGNLGPTLG